MPPKVILGILSYNNASFVRKTLLSAINQTYPNIEIAVHDDCSSDDSLEVIYDTIKNVGKKVLVISSDKNIGICASLNKIIQIAKGDYYCFIGSDDYFLPDFVSKRVALMESILSEYGICYSHSILISEEGAIIGFEERPKSPSGDIFDYLISLKNQSLCKPLSLFYRSKIFEDVGLFDEELLFEDLDFILRCARKTKFYFFNSFDSHYRVRKQGSLGSKVFESRGLKSHFLILNKHTGFNDVTDKKINDRKLYILFAGLKRGAEKELLSDLIQDCSFKQSPIGWSLLYLTILLNPLLNKSLPFFRSALYKLVNYAIK
ncbi:MAG: hypothetical protein CMN32_12915 [Saprospirales bacterium]|nr:hypothetical protein [Saprospirales bacterium]